MTLRHRIGLCTLAGFAAAAAAAAPLDATRRVDLTQAFVANTI